MQASKKWTFFLRVLCTLLVGKCACAKLSAQNIDAPRFFEFNLQSLSSTTTPVFGANPVIAQNYVEPNYLFEASLRFPVKLHGQTRLFGQIDVEQESMFGFWEAAESEVEDIHLYQNQLSFILMHDFNKETRLYSTFRAGTGSSQALDFRVGAHSFSQVTLLEKRNDRRKWGVGLALSYQNRFSFLPVLRYEGPLAGKWNLDVLLPARILINRKLNNSSRLFAGIRGSSATYLVGDNAVVSDLYSNTTYRRLDVRAVFGFERQITPWVGLRGELGANIPYRAGLYDLENPRTQIHDFGQRVMPHANFGFFLSLPK